MNLSISSHTCRLNYCIYKTFLHEPRLYYDKAAKKCGVARNTFTSHWKKGLEKGIFFPPQIRLNAYNGKEEHIYFIRTDYAHEIYDDLKKNPDVLYMIYTLGKFDLLIQARNPLDAIPDECVLYGKRGNYIYPETQNCSFVTTLEMMQSLLEKEHEKSIIPVLHPEEPHLKGSDFGELIFPHVKYNLRTNYTYIVKKLDISFASFYKGLDYLLKISTVLLPYYPMGLMQYSQHLFVIWSDYEVLLCKLFGCFPCHVSIVKVNDFLLVYAPSTMDIEFSFFGLLHRMLKIGYITRFWVADPLYHWKPDF